MNKSEYDRLVEQYLADILQSAGPDVALAIRRAIDNNDLDALSRIAENSEKARKRSWELRAEVDKLERDTQKLSDDVQRLRRGF